MHKLSDYDLETLYKEEKNAEKKIRFLALLHVSKGKNRNEVASIVFKDWQTVDNWLTRFQKFGLEGLEHKSGQGRKPELAKDREEEFKNKLEDIQQNMEGGRLVAKDIKNILSEKFNAEYHEYSVYALLKRLDLVWITARSKHPNHDPVKQEAFKK